MALALAASVAAPAAFRPPRHFAAWLGRVPKQSSIGSKMRLARSSETGDRYLRKLLVVGMTAVTAPINRS